MSEARRLGLVVRPPHVNHSSEVFTLEPPRTLWMGLGQVRELTRATIATLLAQRPFDSLQDVLVRAQPQYAEAVNLVKAGALDGWGNPKTMLAQLERDRWHGRHTGQLGLLPLASIDSVSEPTIHERAAWEREVLGQWVSVHPLQLVTNELSQYNLIHSNALSERVGQDVTVAGIRLATHRFVSKQESMWLVDMEDEHGMYQVLWSGAALERHGPLLSQREPVLIRERVRTDRQGQAILTGYEIKRLQSTPMLSDQTERNPRLIGRAI